MPRSGVRNRANKGMDFPLYHTFAALPTSRDRIKGLFSYLCDCITFWGSRQFLFLHRSAYSSNCSQFAPFLLNAAHSFAYFAAASLASAEQTVASARLAVSMRLSVFRINMLVALMSTTWPLAVGKPSRADQSHSC